MTPDFHRDDLDRLERAGRLRSLSHRTGLDFASNDYLGLANDQRLRDAVADAVARGVAVGSGGSRLLRGNDPEIAALEAEAATLFGAEACLYFATGFAANVALLATLPQPGDLIVHDVMIHASMHDGLRLVPRSGGGGGA
jgi:8-amino-7-oxononanoate synthase